MSTCNNDDFAKTCIRQIHPFEPISNEQSKILVLGTFPSVKSRENSFYYGHPQNRFWRVLALVFAQSVPVTIEQKRALLWKNHVALWDVLESCVISGSSDASIKSATPNDIVALVQNTGIEKIYCNGQKAGALYRKYCEAHCGMGAVVLPSTSPANAAWSLEHLAEAWQQAFTTLGPSNND